MTIVELIAILEQFPHDSRVVLMTDASHDYSWPAGWVTLGVDLDGEFYTLEEAAERGMDDTPNAVCISD